MAVDGSRSIQGWGLAFEEGWNGKKLFGWSFVLVTMAGLLFGVLYGILQRDMQSAFGVSAWVTGLFAIAVAYLGTVDS